MANPAEKTAWEIIKQLIGEALSDATEGSRKAAEKKLKKFREDPVGHWKKGADQFADILLGEDKATLMKKMRDHPDVHRKFAGDLVKKLEAHKKVSKKLDNKAQPGKGRIRKSPPVPPNSPTSSVSNLQGRPQMQGHDDHEVPVIPPPRKIAKTHPDYFTINLPICIRLDPIGVALLTYDNDRPLFTIRLNSIYDPLKFARTGSDFESKPLNDPFQNKNIQPKGRDIWASHFKYYRVLKSEFDISIDSTCACECQLGTGTGSPWENKFCYGYELTDEDGQISNNVDAFLTTKMAKRKMLQPAPAIQQTYWDGAGNPTVTRNTGVSHGAVSYTYNPASWRSHVEQAGLEERWTSINENPGIDHELHMRMFHMNQGTPAGQVSILVTGYYTVQFRETLDSFFKDYDVTAAKHTATYPTAGGNADD